MIFSPPFFFALTAAYLIGSLPTGYLMTRCLKKIDIRTVGSGNVGATNVFRVAGPWAGSATLLVDFLKGFFPVLILAHNFNFTLAQLYCIGLAAIAGHNWTIFLRFKGGKGVATSAGVFLALLPKPLAIAVAIFLIVFLIFKTVSLGSIVAAISLPVSTWCTTRSVFSTIVTASCAALVLVMHRKNIQRLIDGTEPKISLNQSKGMEQGTEQGTEKGTEKGTQKEPEKGAQK